MANRTESAAADEVHNLKPVAVVEDSRVPAIARHDVSIQFDRHPVRLHSQALDQSGKRERTGRTCKLPFFPIDMKFHLS